jgi:hypothetical protein
MHHEQPRLVNAAHGCVSQRCLPNFGTQGQKPGLHGNLNKPRINGVCLMSILYREFEDYSAEDLWHIMRDTARQRYGWSLGPQELTAGIKALDKERLKPNFGNAGGCSFVCRP